MHKHKLLLLLFLPLLAFAKKKPLPPPLPRAAAIPYQKQAPDWTKIPPLPGDFSINRSPQPTLPTQNTEVRMAWNEEALSVHFHCFEDNMKNLITYHRDGAIWQNDCIEFFIDPSAERQKVLQIICSADGQFRLNTRGLQLAHRNVTVIVKTFADHWEAELTLPWSMFAFRPKMFRAALSRERRAGLTEYSTWNWPSGFNSVSCHAYFFAGDALEILREMHQRWQYDQEFLQILAQQEPDAAKEWQDWLRQGEEVIGRAQITHSPELVDWLNQAFLLQRRHPRQDTIYKSKIADLLKKP